MFKVPLVQPGSRLDGFGRASGVGALLDTAREGLHDAAIALDDFKRCRAARGPGDFDWYEARRPFLYAQTFILSLARVGRALAKLAESVPQNVALAAAAEDFVTANPHVRGVRNSQEHMEDRSRSLGGGRKTKPMTPEPFEIPGKNGGVLMAAPGGALVCNMFVNSTLHCTLDDGTLGEVDIEDATLESARLAVQKAFDALPWDGEPLDYP